MFEGGFFFNPQFSPLFSSKDQDSGDSATGYATLLGALETENREEVEDELTGPITTKHLLSWACQVARGMEYLASKKVRPPVRSPPQFSLRSFMVTWLRATCCCARATLPRSATLVCPRLWRGEAPTQRSRTRHCLSSGWLWRP